MSSFTEQLNDLLGDIKIYVSYRSYCQRIRFALLVLTVIQLILLDPLITKSLLFLTDFECYADLVLGEPHRIACRVNEYCSPVLIVLDAWVKKLDLEMGLGVFSDPYREEFALFLCIISVFCTWIIISVLILIWAKNLNYKLLLIACILSLYLSYPVSACKHWLFQKDLLDEKYSQLISSPQSTSKYFKDKILVFYQA